MLKVEDIELGIPGKNHLEFDETNMRDSPKTEKFNLKDLRENPLVNSDDRSPTSDSKLKTRSDIESKPKLLAKKQTGVLDNDSMKLGSVDENEEENSSVNSSKLSNFDKK